MAFDPAVGRWAQRWAQTRFVHRPAELLVESLALAAVVLPVGLGLAAADREPGGNTEAEPHNSADQVAGRARNLDRPDLDRPYLDRPYLDRLGKAFVAGNPDHKAGRAAFGVDNRVLEAVAEIHEPDASHRNRKNTTGHFCHRRPSNVPHRPEIARHRAVRACRGRYRRFVAAIAFDKYRNRTTVHTLVGFGKQMGPQALHPDWA